MGRCRTYTGCAAIHVPARTPWSHARRYGTPALGPAAPKPTRHELGGGARAFASRRGKVGVVLTQAEAQESIELAVGLTAGGGATDSFRGAKPWSRAGPAGSGRRS